MRPLATAVNTTQKYISIYSTIHYTFIHYIHYIKIITEYSLLLIIHLYPLRLRWFISCISGLVLLRVYLIDMKWDQERRGEERRGEERRTVCLLFMSTSEVRTSLLIRVAAWTLQILQVVELNQNYSLPPSHHDCGGLTCVKRLTPSQCWWLLVVTKCLKTLTGTDWVGASPLLCPAPRHRSAHCPGVRAESEADLVL